MQLSHRSAFKIGIVGTIWPCALFLLSTSIPGPDVSGGLELASANRPALALPPVETTPQRYMLESQQMSARAEVFWQEPTKARIKWQIEIKPQQQQQ